MEPAAPVRRVTPEIAVIIAGGLIALAIGIAGRSTVPSASPQLVAEGEPYVGSATAPVTLAYWFDFQCPYCKQTESVVMPQLVSDYVQTGVVKIVFKDLQFLGPDSEAAGIVARAVWETAPADYYAWHQAVFARQDAENGGWGNTADLAAVTEEVLGKDAAARVATLASQKRAAYLAQLKADRAEGARLGITATPGFLINGSLVSGAVPYTDMKAAIEAARAR